MDFEQLEAFIQNNAGVHSPTQTNVESSQLNPTANLPESPPDSGSEPPYSPNIKVNQTTLQIDHMQQQTLNTLTELHVPHHQQLHHHNLLTPSSDLYLTNEHHHQQQQLLQINNILHKHDGSLLSHHSPATQDHQMLLYQVNQNGQIMELSHHHNIQQQQSQPMSNRLYKNDIMELDATAPLPLPAMHDIQQTSIQGTMTTDNLPIIIGAADNSYQQQTTPRNMAHEQQQQQQLSNHGMTNGIGHVKKRKNAAQNFNDGDSNIKAYVKSNIIFSSKMI